MGDFLSGAWSAILVVLGWLSLPLFGLSVWLLVRSVKREMRLRMRVLLLPLLTTVLVPIVYITLLGVDPPRLLSAFLWFAGIGAGVLWANTTALSLGEDGEVMGKRSWWYLVVWGATFVLTQLMAIAGSRTLAQYGISTMYLSMGISIGMNGNLLFRRSQVKAGKPDAPIGPVLGRALRPGEAAPQASDPIPGGAANACPDCGGPLVAGAEFCVACGRALA